MTGDESSRASTGSGAVRRATRRRVLGVAGAALAAGLAGCSSVTSQEFAASPVRLPEGVREELGLGELFADARTTTRERTVGDQDVEVTITNQFAGYGRAATGPVTWSGPRPTLLERFAWGPEATPGSGSAINATAAELDLGPGSPAFLEGDASVDPDLITLVIPARGRDNDTVELEDVLALHHARALGVEQLTSRGGANYLVDAPSVLPPASFMPTGSQGWRNVDGKPDDRWILGSWGDPWIPDDPSSLQCVVCLGERTPGDVFGVDEMPGRRLDEGEPVGTENTILLAPAPKEYPDPDGWSEDPARIFDAGHPSPLGGPTYALGVIATPNAEIGGESVNPLARTSTGDLLVSDLASDVLPEAGLTDADEVEWLRGPVQQPGAAWTPHDTVSVLGEETPVESFGGVVSGEDGPWAVALHLAKGTPDDVVIPVAMHRRPVGTPDGRPLYPTDRRGFIDKRWTIRAIEFTAEVAASLEADGGTDG